MIRALACATALLVSTGVARAQPPSERADRGVHRRIVGVLEVRVEGVPKEIQKQFQSDLENQLDSTHYWLAPQQRMRDMMQRSTKWTEGCVIGDCLKEVKVQTGADLVLLASITGADNSFGYIVTLVRTDTGAFLAQAADRCEVCTVNEALAKAILAAVRLVTAVPDQLPDEDAATRAQLARVDLKATSDADAAKHHDHVLGVALTLAGLAVAGAGMTLYFVDDRPAWALAGAGAGAGAALGGVVALTF